MFLEILSSFFIWTGVVFIAIATIGILRLPDFYIRMSAITKAATFGIGCIIFGISIYFNETGIVTRAIFIILFLLLTSPIAAHLISRAAYLDKVPFWRKTFIDEFQEFVEKEKSGIRLADSHGDKIVEKKTPPKSKPHIDIKN